MDPSVPVDCHVAPRLSCLHLPPPPLSGALRTYNVFDCSVVIHLLQMRAIVVDANATANVNIAGGCLKERGQKLFVFYLCTEE